MAETVGGKVPTLVLQEIVAPNRIKDLSRKGKLVLDHLRARGPDGAATNDLAVELNLMPNRVGHILGKLEPTGEVFKKGNMWVSTDAVIFAKLGGDAKRELDRVRTILEKDLFGNGGLSDETKAFLEVYASGRNLPTPLTPDEALHFARLKFKEGR